MREPSTIVLHVVWLAWLLAVVPLLARSRLVRLALLGLFMGALLPLNAVFGMSLPEYMAAWLFLHAVSALFGGGHRARIPSAVVSGTGVAMMAVWGSPFEWAHVITLAVVLSAVAGGLRIANGAIQIATEGRLAPLVNGRPVEPAPEPGTETRKSPPRDLGDVGVRIAPGGGAEADAGRTIVEIVRVRRTRREGGPPGSSRWEMRREQARLPANDYSHLVRQQGGGEPAVVDAIATQLASGTVGSVWSVATSDWHVIDAGSFDAGAQVIAALKSGLHERTGNLVEAGAGLLGAPGFAADAAEWIAVGVALPGDSLLRRVKRTLQLCGFVVGMIAGNPALAIACVKSYTRDKLVDAVRAAIKDLFRRSPASSEGRTPAASPDSRARTAGPGRPAERSSPASRPDPAERPGPASRPGPAARSCLSPRSGAAPRSGGTAWPGRAAFPGAPAARGRATGAATRRGPPPHGHEGARGQRQAVRPGAEAVAHDAGHRRQVHACPRRSRGGSRRLQPVRGGRRARQDPPLLVRSHGAGLFRGARSGADTAYRRAGAPLRARADGH
ncbi:hypothetical protein [Microbispora sp. NPDC049125]|uniref:hypothetical protein n=1 Tax=Microbispora sp. NPDC049125 TaxID=3154929 RepID=UPI003466DCC8